MDMIPRPVMIPRADLNADVRRLFRPDRRSEGCSVGIELELIPMRVEDGSRVPVGGDGTPGTTGIALLEAAGRGRGWKRDVSPAGSPSFSVPGAGVFSFEPGGQLELSSAPAPSVDALVEAVHGALGPVYRAAGESGVRLVARGLDPHRCADDVPLMLHSERYRKQLAHYDRIGSAGRSMMLCSAALHVNVDVDGRSLRRWTAANRMTPYLVAIFANSRVHRGRASGHRSHRAEQWRHLDPSRTGVGTEAGDAISGYLCFALDALDFLRPDRGKDARPFCRAWRAGASRAAWRTHLTTLFPEVRPRGATWSSAPWTLCAPHGSPSPSC